MNEPRWRMVLRRSIVTCLILVIIGGFWLAMSRTKTGDTTTAITGGSSVARILSPKDGDRVVNQQAQISLEVDLRYRATLTVKDTAIPDDQVTKLPQASATQFLFTPGAGKVISALPEGTTCVRADFYRVDGTAELINPVRWCFQVV